MLEDNKGSVIVMPLLVSVILSQLILMLPANVRLLSLYIMGLLEQQLMIIFIIFIKNVMFGLNKRQRQRYAVYNVML